MLYVTEGDVKENLSMKDLIPALKDFISDYGKGDAFSSPRNRIIAGTHILNTMPASAPKYNVAGLKSYISSRNGFRAVGIGIEDLCAAYVVLRNIVAPDIILRLGGLY